MATRLRHIAIIVPDPEKAATFFEQAFGMTRAGTARRGVYMSDGVMNVALLKTEGDEKPGLYHFGMWVDDLDEAEDKVKRAGGTYLAGRPTSDLSFYEAKYRDPDGVVFDLTHTGWRGAVKEVVPAAREKSPARLIFIFATAAPTAARQTARRLHRARREKRRRCLPRRRAIQAPRYRRLLPPRREIAPATHNRP